MSDRITVNGLQVATVLHDFINNEALPGTGVDADAFWAGAASVIADLVPRNRELLAVRDDLQTKLDAWHRDHKDADLTPGTADFDSYKSFLTEIGYLAEVPADFQITTSNVDREIADTAGPQLVVPILNARFALNASNARWGSLYDALYGTDAISEADGAEKGSSYNKVRGDKVIAYAKDFLDQAVPLEQCSYTDVRAFAVRDGALQVTLDGDKTSTLADPTAFVGYRGDAASPTSILLRNNGLHLDIEIDPSSPIGSTDPAGIKDVVVESAITTIMDFEDSVAAVDAEDKVVGYRNWLGLNKGDLSEEVTKGGKTFTRVLNGNREYTAPDGTTFDLHGRSLLFVRNVGHLMTNDAILDADGNEVPEGILDG
ncbi:malate synthase G, partial [Gordonia sp. (in: high G+C Gram-positive bacteria)]|uniref:malate synthase G n=1 Tax=Gordonia sp. (in: high G+C Gram-positive bacteria) TaxID=84139 RepID=UPI0035AE0F96